MRCALLGDGRALCALAMPLVARGGQIHLSSPAARRLGALRGGEARLCQVPDEAALLELPAFDLVVVSRADEQVARIARQLAAAGAFMLVDLESSDPRDLYHEFTILNLDHESAWVPALFRRGATLAARLRMRLQQGALGSISHVRVEACLPPALDRGAPLLLPEPAASARLIGDFDLLRCLFGEFDRVTCLCAGESLNRSAAATVTLAGQGVPQVVWAVSCAAPASWSLTVHAERGTARLAEDEAAGLMRLELHVSGQEPVFEQAPLDGAEWLIGALLDARGPSRAPGAQRPDAQVVPLPRWNDLAVGVELLEAVAESVRRRRTIEVYRAAHSERSAFKTQMTALGCGLLMATLAAAVAYLLVAAALPLPVSVQRLLVALIFAPLGLFLALQVLIVLARPRSGQ